MISKIKLIFVLSMQLFILPGCGGRFVEWGKDCFYQGEDFCDYSCVPYSYVCGVTVYDLLDTLGIFDAMWLSDPVRATYAQLNSRRNGKSSEHTKAFLRRQLEENKHFIDFYVLTTKFLGSAESEWSLFLTVDDKSYSYIKIKGIDLPSEYKFFFGKSYNRSKIVYLVRFNAYDVENRPIIKPDTSQIKLVFSSVKKEADLTWYIKELPQLKDVVGLYPGNECERTCDEDCCRQ